MEEVTKKIAEAAVAAVTADADMQRLAKGNVFSFFSKQPVQGAFVAFENYVTNYVDCKDGNYPDSFAFTVSCVAESLTTVEALALRIDKLLNNRFFEDTSSALRLMSAVTSGDGNDIICKLNFKIEL